MILEIEKQQIEALTQRQLSSLFVLSDDEAKIVGKYLDKTLERCEKCFVQNDNKYYVRNGEVYFNPFHSGQYLTYLYFFANTISKNEERFSVLCDKMYYLNKALNGIDLFYEVDLPEYFAVEHPVGSVLGRANYGNGFSIMQNCTVGGVGRDEGVIYPQLGKNVRMFAGSSIIGDCKIGNNVNIGAGTLIKNQNVGDDVNVFGQSPNLIVKTKKQ